ncbi:MAG: 30S ribosomal protein S6 [Candidatus Paceibacterota bacterium]
MQFYEINVLITSKFSQEEATSLINKLDSSFQSKGKIMGEKKLELKKLAYPINKNEEAWYSFLILYPEAGADKKAIMDFMEKELKENKDIIRYLILSKLDLKARKPGRSERMQIEKAAIATAKPESPTGEPEAEKAHKQVELKDVEEKLKEMLED